MRCFPASALLTVWLACGLPACSLLGGPTAWPTRTVAIDAMQPVAPLALPPIYYRRSEGVPRGSVLLRLLVDEEGRVQRVALMQSSGQPNLDQAAITAAQRASFAPYLIDGQALAVSVLAPIHLS